MQTRQAKRKRAEENINQIKEENGRLKKRLELIETVIKDKTDYSWDLVWYARSHPNEPLGEKGRQEVEEKYPEKVEELKGKDTNWHHGYNSAALALSRLVLGLIHAEEDAAKVINVGGDSDCDGIPVEDMIQYEIEQYPMTDT